MKVTLLKNHSYSLNGRNVISGKKGDVIEVIEARAKSWQSKEVIADKVSTPSKVEVKPVSVPENKMDTQEDKETKEVSAAPKKRGRNKATK
jgi:hypothetical protein